MTPSRRFGLLLVLPLALGNLLVGCDSDDDTVGGSSGTGGGSAAKGGTGGTTGGSGGNGTGGSNTTGGAGGTGGTNATGGTGGSNSTGGTGGSNTTGGTGGTNTTGGTGGSNSTGGSDAMGGAGAGTGGTTGGTGGAGAGAGGTAGASAGMGGMGGAAGGCGTPTRTDIRDFATDDSASGGWDLYLPSGGTSATSTYAYSATEGYTAAGAAQLNAQFAVAGDKVQISFYQAATDWSCKTKWHAMVKLSGVADLSHIEAVQMNLAWNSFAGYTGGYTPVAGWNVDEWHAVDIDLASAYSNPSPPTLTGVVGVNVMLVTKGTGTPVPTIMYVDDIWTE